MIVMRRKLVQVMGAAGVLPMSGLAQAAGSAGPAPARTTGRFESDGTDIYFAESGNRAATAVVLLHGFMVDSATNWAATRRVLAPYFRVIEMDARGHGHSGKPKTADAYGPRMALDVIRLLDHLGVGKAHVVGYSMGGMLALFLAAHQASRLHSAVLAGAGWRDPAEVAAKGGNPALTLALDEAIRTGQSVPDVLTAQNAQYADLPVMRYEPILAFYESLRRVELDPLALKFAHDSLASVTIDASMAKAIELPMLAVCGDRDPSLAPALKLRELNDAVALAVVPFLGHLNSFESDDFNRAILGYLQRIRG